jgi:hypothetical protein
MSKRVEQMKDIKCSLEQMGIFWRIGEIRFCISKQREEINSFN